MDQAWRLPHFLVIAELGSVQAAARHLNVSQPALTKSIKLLEAHLGTILFDRSSRGMMMTSAGRILHDRARVIEMEWNAALGDLDAGRSGARGRLNIGVGPTYAAMFMPQVLARLAKRFPKVEFSVRTGVGTELIPRLRSGEISLYAGGLAEPGEVPSEGIEISPIYQQTNSLAVRADHPILDRLASTPQIDALYNWPWVLLTYDQHGSNAIARYFRKSGLAAPGISVSTGSLSIAIELVRNHDFITSVPEPLLHPAHGLGLAPLPTPGYNWSIPTGLTFRSSIRRTASFRALAEELQTEVAIFKLSSGPGTQIL